MSLVMPSPLQAQVPTRLMWRYLRLLWLQVRMSLISQLQYRWNFLVLGLMQVFWLFVSAVPLWVAFSARAAAQGQSMANTELGGWGLYSSMLVLGVFSLLKAVLDGAINPSLAAVVEHIRKGTLDFVLLKPADAQFLVSTARFEPWHVLDGMASLLLIGYAAHKQGVLAVGAGPLLLAVTSCVVLFLCAILMLYSLWLLVVCAAFYVVRIDNLSYLFTAVLDFARWPRAVFKGALLVVFTYVIPLTVMTSYPVDALLQRLQLSQALWAVAGAGLLLTISRFTWRRAIRQYASASS